MPFSSCHPCQGRCQSSYAGAPRPRPVFYTVLCGHQEVPLELQQFDKVFRNAECEHYTCIKSVKNSPMPSSGMWSSLMSKNPYCK
jgi:hypothetical protein